MNFREFTDVFGDDPVIDIRNVKTYFGGLDRRRLYEWQQRGLIVKLVNRFGIFRYIKAVPPALLLAQKILACLQRKRSMGRDFFDVVFLMSKTDPDYEYLHQRANIEDKVALVNALRRRSGELDMQTLARNVEPFLFDPSQKDRVAHFNEWLATIA